MSTPTLQQWQQDGEYLDFSGHRLFTRSEGRGDALLLIHGFPTSSYDWARLWPKLAQGHRLLAIDMLGFGLSDKPRDFAYCVAASADQWQALVQAEGAQEVSLLAHDYGNTVAQELLARQREGRLPFRIRAAAFLNGGLFPEATFPLLLQKLLLSPVGPLIAMLASYRSFARSLRRICGKPLEESELREHWQLLIRADGKRALPKVIRYIRERHQFRQRWVGALEHAQIPLCLIDGVEDPISGKSTVQRWRELLPEAIVVELDGVGHYPQIEDADRVFAAAEAFFSAARSPQ